MKITAQQKAAIKNLIVSRIGQSIVDKVGAAKRYELEASFRLPETPWNGEHEYTVTLADVVKVIADKLREDVVLEEVVININSYYKDDSGERQHEDLEDQIGISYEDILKTI